MAAEPGEEHGALLALEAAVRRDVAELGGVPLADKARSAKLSAAIQDSLARIRALTRDLELEVEEMDGDEERAAAASQLALHKAEYARLQVTLREAAVSQRTAALRSAAEERKELLAGGEAGLRLRKAQAEGDTVAAAEEVTGGLRRTRQVLAEELEHTSATLAAMEASHTALGRTKDEYQGQHRRLRQSRGLLGTLNWQAKSETYMLWIGLTLFLAVCAYIVQKRAGHFIPEPLKPSTLLGHLTGSRRSPASPIGPQPLQPPGRQRGPKQQPPVGPVPKAKAPKAVPDPARHKQQPGPLPPPKQRQQQQQQPAVPVPKLKPPKAVPDPARPKQQPGPVPSPKQRQQQQPAVPAPKRQQQGPVPARPKAPMAVPDPPLPPKQPSPVPSPKQQQPRPVPSPKQPQQQQPAVPAPKRQQPVPARPKAPMAVPDPPLPPKKQPSPLPPPKPRQQQQQQEPHAPAPVEERVAEGHGRAPPPLPRQQQQLSPDDLQLQQEEQQQEQQPEVYEGYGPVEDAAGPPEGEQLLAQEEGPAEEQLGEQPQHGEGQQEGEEIGEAPVEWPPEPDAAQQPPMPAHLPGYEPPPYGGFVEYEEKPEEEVEGEAAAPEYGSLVVAEDAELAAQQAQQAEHDAAEWPSGAPEPRQEPETARWEEAAEAGGEAVAATEDEAIAALAQEAALAGAGGQWEAEEGGEAAAEQHAPAVHPEGSPEAPAAGGQQGGVILDRQGRRIAVDGPRFVKKPARPAVRPPGEEAAEPAAGGEGAQHAGSEQPAEAAAAGEQEGILLDRQGRRIAVDSDSFVLTVPQEEPAHDEL